MEKIVDATFDGEVFRSDEPIELPSNTKVKIIIEDDDAEESSGKLELVEMPKKGKGEPYAFLKYARSVSIDAPPDYASNIDEYLYGGKTIDEK